jgi:DNA repair exonuclease SbcCD ATPase subunit
MSEAESVPLELETAADQIPPEAVQTVRKKQERTSAQLAALERARQARAEKRKQAAEEKEERLEAERAAKARKKATEQRRQLYAQMEEDFEHDYDSQEDYETIPAPRRRHRDDHPFPGNLSVDLDVDSLSNLIASRLRDDFFSKQQVTKEPTVPKPTAPAIRFF